MKDFFTINLNTVFLAVLIVLMWDGCQVPESNPETFRKIDSLQTVNRILQESLEQSKVELDSAKIKLANSLNNTNAVKKKHEAIRKNISALPVDSQLVLFAKRFSKKAD
jgi:hypothetical protein